MGTPMTMETPIQVNHKKKHSSVAPSTWLAAWGSHSRAWGDRTSEHVAGSLGVLEISSSVASWQLPY